MNHRTHRPYKLVGCCGGVGEVCTREITAVDRIEEETGEGSIALTGCPPQWLDRRGFLMGESYSSSVVLLIQTISLYNPGLPQISQLVKTDLIFHNLS